MLLRGHADAVEGPKEVARLAALGLQTWGTDAAKTTWVRISAEQVTGRRLDLLTER